MSKRLDSEDLDILSNSYVRLVAPVDDKTGEVQASNLDIDSASKMRIVEIYLDDLPSKRGCLEIIKKNNFENNNKLEEIAKRNRRYYKNMPLWHRNFVRSLPNLAYHIAQLPRECSFSVQIEVVRALCRDRNFWFGDPAFRDFCYDPDRSYEIYGKEHCERMRAFINDFIKDLYLRLREPSTRKKIRDARKGAKKRAKEFRKYVLSHFAARTPINVIRIDLDYLSGIYASIEDIIEDLKHFHRNMRHKPRLFKHLIGYVEKIEFGLSKGIHAHLILFFSSERQSSANVYLAQSIGEYWNEITHGNGHYWNINTYEEHYKRMGRLGIGEIHVHDKNAINWLCHDVDYFCKVEQFIKPIAAPKTKLLRRGEMPDLSGPKRGRPRKSPTIKAIGRDTQGSYSPNKPPISTTTLLPDNYPYPNQLPWSGSLKINTNI